ncbi:MAG TPA: type III-B CRISPR module RAMP protein Cmr6 [Clostridiaceae bacterium]|jgi:CRISPR-associated protein Cmr6|nr:type III-B CRISPR module RAMP protein Cmr6 [Clostridiaceae bacterium]HBG38822.1 type III-B CRISPR module RAMP protein Cmr6 [Clostridiaceae bacterium]
MSDNFNDYKDSFVDIEKAYLPDKDTRKLVLDDIDNFNLKLNKAARYDEGTKHEKGKFKFFNKGFQNDDNYLIKANFGDLNFEDICKRQISNIEKMGIENTSFILSPDWRMVVGLGGVSVYETSITLHYIYGFPYIPGQALKGVCRNYAINYFYDCNEDDALNDDKFRKIFGCKEKNNIKGMEGSIMFFDAMPITPPKIEPDIINTHYTEYYLPDKGNIKPPADYYKPIPIPFLTVKDTKFQFVLGLKMGEDISLIDTAKKWMIGALTQSGIGAKTAHGYGYMQEEKLGNTNKTEKSKNTVLNMMISK